MKLKIQGLEWIITKRTKGKLKPDKMAEFVKVFKHISIVTEKGSGGEQALYGVYFKS